MGLKDWLSTGAKPDAAQGDANPLLTEEGIREIQKALAGAKPATLLDQICDALEAAFDAGLDHKALRRALRMLDGGVQKTLADLQQAMLLEAKGGQVPELPAAAIAKYCRRFCVLSERALDAPEGETMTLGASSDALIVIRAMRAWAIRKKLLRMSYRFPDEELWATGNRFMQFSQMRGLLDKETEPYPGTGLSTVRRERLAGLLFDMAPNASMSPAQMECLDLLLRQYQGGFVQRNEPAPDLPFYVDFARAQPAQRWLPGLPVRGTMRFFGPGEALAKIAALAGDAEKNDALPAWALPSGCSVEAYRLVLAMLTKHWSDKPPQRRERRVTANSNVFLVNGFEDVRRALAASEEALKVERSGTPDVKGELMRDDKYFDRIRFGSVNPDKTTTGKLLRKQLVQPKQVLEKRERGEGRPPLESSSVADTSESGIGIALPGRAPWAKVGVLMGYREPESLQWEVAIVRRLVRGQRLSLGLERLRGVPVSGRLSTPGAKTSGFGARDAVVLPGTPGQLIASNDACKEGDVFTITLEAGSFNAKVGRIIEQGPDFVRAEFEKQPA